MATLRQVPGIDENLTKSHTRVIRKLHKLIYGDEGDRKNRKRLRDFAGFEYTENTNEFREKTDWVKQEFTLGDLTSICNVLNIDYIGDEDTIARRICRCLCDLELLNEERPEANVSDEEGDTDDDGADKDEEPVVRALDEAREIVEREREMPEQRNVYEPVDFRQTASFALSFRDVEDTIRPFDGRDNYPIEAWIEDYEETALLFSWNEMQKLVFAKKSLIGLAKSFVQGERGITSWPKLRRKLLSEFSRKVNGAELHRMLCQRKMKRDETVQEYYLIMKEMASRGKIDSDALMQYVIDGIPDDMAYNKSVLYGATDLRQFKDKLTIFSKLRERTVPIKEVPKTLQRGPSGEKKTGSSSNASIPQKKEVVLRCYNCNEEGHRASACEKPKRERGSCYTCGSKDHLQRSCPQRSKPGFASKGASTSAHADTHFIEPFKIIPCYELPVYFEIGKITAMIDTGSPVSLIIASRVPDKADILPGYDSPRFDGVNGSRIQILGRLKQNGYVCGEMISINFYVVPDETMKTPCLLGRDFIVQNNLELSLNNTVTLRKKAELRTEIVEPSYDIMQIDVCETAKSPEVNINPRIDNHTKDIVLEIIENSYVKALRPEQPVVNMVITENSLEDNLQVLQGVDETIKVLRERLEKSEDKNFELNNGLVYRKCGNKLLFYVPKLMEDNVIRMGHEQIGHQGINKSVEFISRTYWFPNLKEKIEKYLENCLKCITYSANANKIEGKLHCPEKGKLPFYCLHIDHYGPLERTANRYKYVFEVIDAFTKFVKFFPTVSTGTDEVIKHLRTYFANYSRPVKIVSDRGSAFTSARFKEFLQEQGIEHVLIATGTPHANGQIERVNRCLTPMLAKLSRTTRTWNEALPNIEFAINNSVNRATKETPARLLFGIDQLGQMRDDLREILSEVTEEDRNLESLRDEANRNITKCQNYNEKYYDKRHKPPTKYREGDLVMLRNVDVNPGVNKKLIPRFKGPYVVKTVLDKDRYVVKDPENYQCTQIPYEGVASPENMRPWLKP